MNLYGFTKALVGLLYVNVFLCVIDIPRHEIPKGKIGLMRKRCEGKEHLLDL